MSAVALATIGLCVGSFLSTLAARSEEGFAGLWLGRSRCPRCEIPLTAHDLVPLVSFALMRGRCRHCGQPIALAYPLTELAAGAVGLVPALMLPLVPAVVGAALGWWLLGLALIDLRILRLPDAMTLPLLAIGLVLAWLQPAALPTPPFREAAVAAAFGGLSLAAIAYGYLRLRGREGLGLGDAKLCAAAGAWVGMEPLPWVILSGALMGLGLALLLYRRLEATAVVPFGAPMALAFWLLYLLGA
ncbi:MAG TPA: prepilin peptidase [Geminicoccaceae bacterium]|nr:prepilin peptidase [Geminicoccus sp.]HMU50712.1 prepilin peptidase [Geminicoccaceae bacterium]